MNLLILFIVLSIVNVVLQTFKSIATVKCGKMGASFANAVAYGLYTVVLVYTNADFPLWEKVIVTAFTNLVGVYIVKVIEEKARKDKLWKIEITALKNDIASIKNLFKNDNISFSIIDTNTEYVVFNAYCKTQKESKTVKDILGKFKVKYFVSESKTL